jgi:hypothetical protein
MHWIYNGQTIQSLEDLPSNCVGIIYKIKNLTNNMFYIGRKILRNKKTLPPLKGKKRKRKLIVESNWKSYTGSCVELNIDIAKGHEIEKEIIHLCFTRKQMSFYELKYQIVENVLERDDCYNSNIMGKFFRRDIQSNHDTLDVDIDDDDE